jgi:hypothetical protein
MSSGHWREKMRSADGNLKYGRLSEVMLLIPTIPYSNAQCERIFGHVTRSRTQFRSSLCDKTLENCRHKNL